MIHGMVTAGMVFRDPPQGSGEQQEKGAAKGWRLRRPCV